MKLKMLFVLLIFAQVIYGMSITDVLKSSTTHTIIITDMEPDDSAAIIACILNGVLPEYVYIVDRSQEDSWDRCKNFEQLLSVMNTEAIPYTYAMPSKIGSLIAEYIDRKNAVSTDEFMIICLANFTPLYDLAQQSSIAKSKITVAAYGSVNMRWTLQAFRKECNGDANAYIAKKDDFFNMLNTGYKGFYLFETFGAFGEKNTADNDTAQQLIEFLKNSTHPVIAFLNEQISSWNDNILKSEIKDLSHTEEYQSLTSENIDSYAEQLKKSAEDKNFSDRLSAKIVYSIWKCKYQFVFADIGLMIALLYKEFNCLFEKKHLNITDKFLEISDHDSLNSAFYFINTSENKTELLHNFSLRMLDIYKKLA